MIGVVLALVFTMGGGGSSEPKTTVEHFMAAAKNNDKQTARKYVCDSLKSTIESDDGSDSTLRDYSVGDAKVDGDTARVPVQVTDEDSKSTTTFVLNKRHGSWLICDAEEGDTTGSSSRVNGPSAPGN